MKELEQAIKWLYDNDAEHRKGFRIRNATSTLACANAVEELGELLVELTLGRPEQARAELVDVFAIVCHLSMLLNYDLDELEQAAIKKLKRRFSFPYDQPIPDYADVIDITQFKSAVDSGCITPDDGSGHPVKNGMMDSRDCFELPDDATHVAWFNK